MQNVLRPLLMLLLLGGCAGNPLETNNITRDGRIYRDTETIDEGETRTTINVRGGTF